MSQSCIVSQAHVTLVGTDWRTKYANITRGIAIATPGKKKTSVAKANEIVYGVTMAPLLSQKAHVAVAIGGVAVVCMAEDQDDNMALGERLAVDSAGKFVKHQSGQNCVGYFIQQQTPTTATMLLSPHRTHPTNTAGTLDSHIERKSPETKFGGEKPPRGPPPASKSEGGDKPINGEPWRGDGETAKGGDKPINGDGETPKGGDGANEVDKNIVQQYDNEEEEQHQTLKKYTSEFNSMNQMLGDTNNGFANSWLGDVRSLITEVKTVQSELDQTVYRFNTMTDVAKVFKALTDQNFTGSEEDVTKKKKVWLNTNNESADVLNAATALRHADGFELTNENYSNQALERINTKIKGLAMKLEEVTKKLATVEDTMATACVKDIDVYETYLRKLSRLQDTITRSKDEIQGVYNRLIVSMREPAVDTPRTLELRSLYESQLGRAIEMLSNCGDLRMKCAAARDYVNGIQTQLENIKKTADAPVPAVNAQAAMEAQVTTAADMREQIDTLIKLGVTDTVHHKIYAAGLGFQGEPLATRGTKPLAQSRRRRWLNTAHKDVASDLTLAGNMQDDWDTHAASLQQHPRTSVFACIAATNNAR